MLNYEVKAHSKILLINTLINLENHQSNTSKIDSILLSLIKTTDNSINLVNQESYRSYLLKNKPKWQYKSSDRKYCNNNRVKL